MGMFIEVVYALISPIIVYRSVFGVTYGLVFPMLCVGAVIKVLEGLISPILVYRSVY